MIGRDLAPPHCLIPCFIQIQMTMNIGRSVMNTDKLFLDIILII